MTGYLLFDGYHVALFFILFYWHEVLSFHEGHSLLKLPCGYSLIVPMVLLPVKIKASAHHNMDLWSALDLFDGHQGRQWRTSLSHDSPVLLLLWLSSHNREKERKVVTLLNLYNHYQDGH